MSNDTSKKLVKGMDFTDSAPMSCIKVPNRNKPL
ncbi:Hypothetical protein FNO222_1116 [Francisella orientalis]|uniref:Uncharacterized protein n=1 Tax=Francisella orientalis TaxID=299583 RepID=A0ABM5U6D1_9GAMM|nr:hypothetical protein FNO12_1107 [Francisella orientalis FNO12]AKN87270.1 Hypothetical protein FNO24_1109 [Francisella orientalis FNO24]AKN88807.1 Hypothetical protein FNO190_1107 [Francisella orientalis]AKU05565.1 Hypothetical protein FNO01_1107 [Francisella orientalis]QEN20478.1 Hypothetical protein FNO39_1116 [Francisella orientalis]